MSPFFQTGLPTGIRQKMSFQKRKSLGRDAARQEVCRRGLRFKHLPKTLLVVLLAKKWNHFLEKDEWKT